MRRKATDRPQLIKPMKSNNKARIFKTPTDKKQIGVRADLIPVTPCAFLFLITTLMVQRKIGMKRIASNMSNMIDDLLALSLSQTRMTLDHTLNLFFRYSLKESSSKSFLFKRPSSHSVIDPFVRVTLPVSVRFVNRGDRLKGDSGWTDTVF